MKGSILIVDDEFGLAEVLAEILRELQYEVRIALNGKLGLQAIAEQRPDLVLLDLMMPVLDGRETLRILRDDPELTDLPVVLMTAVPDMLRKVQGSNGALLKPFHPTELIALVKRLLP